MITPNTRVRVTSGPHAGHDGTVIKHAHGVVEIESWLDREVTFWALEQCVEVLGECPASLAPQTRKALAAGLRDVVARLEAVRRGAIELRDEPTSRQIWKAQQDLASLAGGLGA